MVMTEKKREYNARDMKEWCTWWNEDVVWSSHFPLRTVTALRVAIVEPKVIDLIYRAAWQRDINIGDDNALQTLLSSNGFDGSRLLREANSPAVKDQLRLNTERAEQQGIIGVPSYQIFDEDVYLDLHNKDQLKEAQQQTSGKFELLWGQDRLNVVCDLLCGWQWNHGMSKL